MKFEVTVSAYEGGRKRAEYDLNKDLDGEFTLTQLLKWTKAALIVITDEVLKEEQAKGFDKDPIIIVDGRRGKPVKDVNPLGQIEVISRQSFGTILVEAYEGLLKRSPVLKGDYIKSHYVFLNGAQVATDMTSLQLWLKSNPTFKEGDILRIINIQPYGRRLELLGVTAGRQRPKLEEKGRRKGERTGVFYKTPNGAYQLTARSIKSKYKQNALIRFSFIPGSSFGLSGSFKGGRAGKNSAGRPYLYPSLIFTIQERGIV